MEFFITGADEAATITTVLKSAFNIPMREEILEAIGTCC